MIDGILPYAFNSFETNLSAAFLKYKHPLSIGDVYRVSLNYWTVLVRIAVKSKYPPVRMITMGQMISEYVAKKTEATASAARMIVTTFAQSFACRSQTTANVTASPPIKSALAYPP